MEQSTVNCPLHVINISYCKTLAVNVQLDKLILQELSEILQHSMTQNFLTGRYRNSKLYVTKQIRILKYNFKESCRIYSFWHEINQTTTQRHRDNAAVIERLSFYFRINGRLKQVYDFIVTYKIFFLKKGNFAFEEFWREIECPKFKSCDELF